MTSSTTTPAVSSRSDSDGKNNNLNKSFHHLEDDDDDDDDVEEKNHRPSTTTSNHTNDDERGGEAASATTTNSNTGSSLSSSSSRTQKGKSGATTVPAGGSDKTTMTTSDTDSSRRTTSTTVKKAREASDKEQEEEEESPSKRRRFGSSRRSSSNASDASLQDTAARVHPPSNAIAAAAAAAAATTTTSKDSSRATTSFKETGRPTQKLSKKSASTSSCKTKSSSSLTSSSATAAVTPSSSNSTSVKPTETITPESLFQQRSRIHRLVMSNMEEAQQWCWDHQEIVDIARNDNNTISHQSKTANQQETDPVSTSFPSKHHHRSSSIVSQLLHDKTVQIQSLQTQLQQHKSQIAALEASNTTVRDENQVLQQRLQATSNTLKIAGRNAAKARDDATQAEAMATSLSDTVEHYQHVIHETKQLKHLLHAEHVQISQQVQAVQTKLTTTLSQQMVLQDKVQHLETQLRLSQGQLQTSQDTCKEWETKHEQLQFQYNDLQRQVQQYQELDQARRIRSQQLAKDRQVAHGLVESVTRTQEENQTTLQHLQTVLEQLQQRNHQLSQQLHDLQIKSQRENERMNAALTKALVETQHLELQLESVHETHAAQKVEWQNRMEQLQHQVRQNNQSQRRLDNLDVTGATPLPSLSNWSIPRNKGGDDESHAKGSNTSPPQATGTMTDYSNDSTAATTPHPSVNKLATPGTSASTMTTTTTAPFSLPPLHRSNSSSKPPPSQQQEQRHEMEAGAKPKASRSLPVPPTANDGQSCAMCHKAPYGMMQSCMCGTPSCRLRAHWSCVNAGNRSRSFDATATTRSQPLILLCRTTATTADTDDNDSPSYVADGTDCRIVVDAEVAIL